MKNFLLSCILLVSAVTILPAQSSDTTRLTISTYVDAYYARFSDTRAVGALQEVQTVSARDNQFSLNIAQIGLHYENPWLRGNVTIHHGDIALATWSGRFRAVQEANVGLLLAKDLWLDIGLFPTHIGTESFLPKNNLLSSTAVATYNEPFYQAGARLSYGGWDNVDLELWVVNGYNLFRDINRSKSVGMLLSVALSDASSLTYTNLFGNEKPELLPVDLFRTYHNLYYTTSFGSSQLIIGGDFGTQSNSPLSGEGSTMYNALITFRQDLSDQYSATIRGEVFNDPDGFISGFYATSAGLVGGLEMFGVTLGLEYRPYANSYLRLESRYIQAAEELQIFESLTNNGRLEAMITAGFELNHKLYENVVRTEFE